MGKLNGCCISQIRGTASLVFCRKVYSLTKIHNVKPLRYYITCNAAVFFVQERTDLCILLADIDSLVSIACFVAALFL